MAEKVNPDRVARLAEAKKEPEFPGVRATFRKRILLKPDGRKLIYYSWGRRKNAPGHDRKGGGG